MVDYFRLDIMDWYKRRLITTICLVFAFFLLLFGRLYYLQIIKGDELRQLSENNRVRLQSILPMRGLIFDRHGALMVDNRPSFNLAILLKDAENPEVTVKRAAELLDISPEYFLERLKQSKEVSPYRPFVLKRDINRDELGLIEAHRLELPGIFIVVEPRRFYIEEGVACHLIGYLSEISKRELESGQYPNNRLGDLIGKFGIERAYESFLHGKCGSRYVEVNSRGQVIKVLKTVKAVPGDNIYLTIDLELQHKAEELMRGRVGAVVAMDPKSGEVLAMVSSPGFDQNAFIDGMSYKDWDKLVTNPFRPLENKAIQGQYPPGSIFKIITAMAALEEGVIDRRTKLFCPGYYIYGTRRFRCWKDGGHGNLNVVEALAKSCDVFFYQLGERLGVDVLARYAKLCGLGARTGIDLDNEAKGLVPTSEWKLREKGVSWQGGETLSVAVGQSFNLVTPIQMVSLIGAVANGGIRYRPLTVKRIESSNGHLVKAERPEPMGRLPVSQTTLQIIREGLLKAVNTREGTGWVSQIPGLKVAGKTGTAQVVTIKRKNVEDESEAILHQFRDHAWFIAFAPSEDPKIAVAVLIEHGGYGGEAAAPVAKELIESYLKDGV